MKCNLCGSEKNRILFRGKENNSYKYYDTQNYGIIRQCDNCRLIFSEHKKNVRTNYSNVVDEDYLKSKEARIKTAERDLAEIEKIKRNKGKILDIGCGAGFFLKAAKDKGWYEFGVELSKWAYNYCKKEGLNVYNTSIEDAKFPKNFFDVITLWDVIEHIENPTVLLENVNALLKKDGILVLNTPDIGSLSAKIMGKNWLNLMAMHIFYFDRKTIKLILNKTGFDIIKIKSYSRIILPKYAINWIKNYKVLFKVCDWILNWKVFNDFKININLFDNMLIYAKKKNTE